MYTGCGRTRDTGGIPQLQGIQHQSAPLVLVLALPLTLPMLPEVEPLRGNHFHKERSCQISRTACPRPLQILLDGPSRPL